MARPLRLEFPGALWHVTNRGVEQRSIYADDRDRRRFLRLVARVVVERRWKLFAFVLMTNHYHLLFETPEPNLSLGMKDLDGDYASGFNARHLRAGHLFQGRFKSHLVDSETYLLEVARYIVLNPVRARMVAAATEWRWSSYRATAGLMMAPSWLDPQPILQRLHPTSSVLAAAEYRSFVAAATAQTPSPWEKLVAQSFLGSADFLRRIEEHVCQREWSHEHPRPQRGIRTTSLETLRATVEDHAPDEWSPRTQSSGRFAFALLAGRHTNATRAAIGRSLGITGQAAGQLIATAEKRLRTDEELMRLVAIVERGVTQAEEGSHDGNFQLST